MQLQLIKAHNFRNALSFHLELDPVLNLIYGPTGGGKTSILEAIHFLGLGRSFRTNVVNRVIHYDAQSFSVFGVIEQTDIPITSIGIEKNRQEKIRIKIGSDVNPSLAQLAHTLPLQLINPDSYDLLNLGPKERRKFLDWGMFHVEHRFYPVWQRFQRIVKQRNAALQQAAFTQIKAWDLELAMVANELTELRKEFVQLLTPVFFEYLEQLMQLRELNISYYQGWDEQRNLIDVLQSSLQSDARLGYTQYGPQKADLVIKIKQTPIQDVLSRGEQKIVVIALQLAMGRLLWQQTKKRCIYLLDDIAAELDENRRQLIMSVLLELNSQIFITTADRAVVQEMAQSASHKLFHVEHGESKEVGLV